MTCCKANCLYAVIVVCTVSRDRYLVSIFLRLADQNNLFFCCSAQSSARQWRQDLKNPLQCNKRLFMLLLLLLSTDNENIGGSDFDLSLNFLSPSFLLFSRVPSCLYLYWLRNYGSQLLSNPTHQMISKCNPIKRLLRHFFKHFLKFLSIPLAESIPTLMTHRISYGHGWPTA